RRTAWRRKKSVIDTSGIVTSGLLLFTIIEGSLAGSRSHASPQYRGIRTWTPAKTGKAGAARYREAARVPRCPRWMAGRTTLTMVLSSRIFPCPMHMAKRVSRRRGRAPPEQGSRGAGGSRRSLEDRFAPFPLEGQDGPHGRQRGFRRGRRHGVLAVGGRALLHEQVVDGPLDAPARAAHGEAPGHGHWRVEPLVGRGLAEPELVARHVQRLVHHV